MQKKMLYLNDVFKKVNKTNKTTTTTITTKGFMAEK